MNSFLKNIFKKKFFIPLLLLLSLTPTVFRMLRHGIFSTQDFHIFRLMEFEKCLVNLQIPCRWSPDVAHGYGQPLFNFYGQLVYLAGEVFRLFGFSLINSTKILFILSFLLSGLSMYLLAKSIWKNNWSAFFSSILYVYAPYRALDVYVRGALPEAFSFVLFPVITLFFNKTIETKSKKYLLFFTFFFTVLLLSHNLSAFIFLFFLIPWAIYMFIKHKAHKLIPMFILAVIIAVGLSSYYLLPLLFESQYISLQRTITGYYSFFNHFASIDQLFISRFWGYGGSPDFISLSIGHVQWILPLLCVPFILFKKLRKNYLVFIVFLLIGWFSVYLTHNKSTLIWNNFSPLRYVQFPWRFIGLVVFCFSLAGGYLVSILGNNKIKTTTTIILSILIIVLNVGFFREDLWFDYSDKDLFSGASLEQQISSSQGDYWPKYGPDLPTKPAPEGPTVVMGVGTAELIDKKFSSSVYSAKIASNLGIVQFPIVYFPGWQAIVNGKPTTIHPSGNYGVISLKLTHGQYDIKLKYTDTPIRLIGNAISLLTIIGLLLFWKYYSKTKR